ncbi:MAG: hypothetical protein WKG07_48790 [Hymenobacter sp.]
MLRTAPTLPAGTDGLPALRAGPSRWLPWPGCSTILLAGGAGGAAGCWAAGRCGASTAGAGGGATGRYKRRKNHVYFLAQFARHAGALQLSRSAPVVERAVTLWKNYLSSLENSSPNSLTTTGADPVFQQ